MNPRPPITALLIDLSGTLHVGSSSTSGAIAALHKLRAAKIPFRFCSNTSKESKSDLYNRLRQIGFDVNIRELWTSLGAVKSLLDEKSLKRSVVLVYSQSVKILIKAKCSPFVLLSDSARAECIPDDNDEHEQNYDCVVVGLSPPHFTYQTLTTAFRILKSPSNTPTPLIATHKAKYIQTPTGLSLGPGPFVEALEHAAGVQAQVVGKPSRKFFELVINSFEPHEVNGTDSGRIAIIGDDVEADLGGGALELGLYRVLVKTGKYRLGDEEKVSVSESPDEVVDSFAAFVDDLVRLRNKL